METGLPLVVIVGPTASGKTSLSIELAKQFGGEVICADSRTVYKYMDIGTAKPATWQQDTVPHWGINLIEPDQRFNAYDFKLYAQIKIREIQQRGNIPFLVGGTGLYVDAIIYDYSFESSAKDTRVTKNLAELSVDQLLEYCKKNNVKLPMNHKNKRHLVTAIIQKNKITTRRTQPTANSIIVGITTDKEILQERIAERTEHLFDNGVVEEAKELGNKYGWESEAMTGNIYRILEPYIKNEIELDEAKSLFKIADWQLAKRQLTWFRRNKDIVWLSLEDARRYLENVLDEHKS